MEPDQLPVEVDDAVARIAELVGDFEADTNEDLQGRVFDLLRSIDLVHRAGLRKIDELLKAAGLQARALDDPEVKLLYDMYDLGEGGELQRAEAVLASVSPYIESHGGKLSVVEADHGVVRVQLAGACSSCQGSTATLRHVVEGALRDGLVGFVKMEVVEAAAGAGHAHGGDQPAAAGMPAGFIPLESLRPVAPRLTWHAVFGDTIVAVGQVRSVVVADVAVLVANVAGEHFAYRDICPGTPLSLESSVIDGHELTCPWHGCRFDLRGGRRVVGEGPGLAVVPISVADGEVRIGVLSKVAA